MVKRKRKCRCIDLLFSSLCALFLFETTKKKRVENDDAGQYYLKTRERESVSNRGISIESCFVLVNLHSIRRSQMKNDKKKSIIDLRINPKESIVIFSSI